MNELQKGDRVEMTELAIENFINTGNSSSRTGVVVGFGRPSGLRVLRDGYKVPATYHRDYWRAALQSWHSAAPQEKTTDSTHGPRPL